MPPREGVQDSTPIESGELGLSLTEEPAGLSLENDSFVREHLRENSAPTNLEATNEDVALQDEWAPDVLNAPEGPMTPEKFSESLQAFEGATDVRQEEEVATIAKEKPGILESLRGRIESFGSWYNKALTPKQKLALGIGLGALGAGAAAVGVAGGIAGGVIGTVMMARRFAGAAGTYAMLEAGLAKAYEKRGIERSKLHKTLGSAGALTLSALIGGGAVSEAVRGMVDYAGGATHAVAEAVAVHSAHAQEVSTSSFPPVELETPSSVEIPDVEINIHLEGVHDVRSGESLTDILKGEVVNTEAYKELTAGQRENIVANLLTKIKADPSSFGISSGNVDVLNVGDQIDLEKIGVTLSESKVNGESFLAHAQHLRETTLGIPGGVENSGFGGKVEHLVTQSIQHSFNEISTADNYEVLEQVHAPGLPPVDPILVPIEPQMEAPQVDIPEPNIHIDAPHDASAEHTLLGNQETSEVAQVHATPEKELTLPVNEKLTDDEMKYFGKKSNIASYIQGGPGYQDTVIDDPQDIDRFVSKNSYESVRGKDPFESSMDRRFSDRPEVGRVPYSRQEKLFITEHLKGLMHRHPQSFGLPTGELNGLPPGTMVSGEKMKGFITELHRVYEMQEQKETRNASVRKAISGVLAGLLSK